MPPKEPCGCGFGHSRKSAFGAGADKFFVNNFTGPASINTVKNCLQYGYQNVVPLTRFGKTKFGSNGPMKIGKKK
jgi:hypothetical protein